MEYPDLHRYPYFAYDTETNGLRYPIHRAFACSISAPDGKSWYYDFRRQPKAIGWLNDQFKRLDPRKNTVICHNANFDACMSAVAGIFVNLDCLDDTGIRAVLIDEHLATQFPWLGQQPGNYDLDYLARKYLGQGKLEIDIENIADLPYEEVAGYAIQDTELTLRLWEHQQPEFEDPQMARILRLERDVMPRVIRAEMRGIRVDLDRAEQAHAEMTPAILNKQAQMNEMAGWDFNVNSAPQVRKLFQPEERGEGIWYVGDTRIGTTSKGAPSFGGEFLRQLAEVDARAEKIVEIRSALKTRDTFLAKHILEWSVDGRVYPHINQVASERGGTKWGRFSYVDPAMQQIPSRDKVTASIIKPCFLPDEGEVWVDYDLNSFEVRVFAALAGLYDNTLVRLYQANPEIDLHQWVADEMGLPRKASYGGEPNAKQLNLSIIFTQGKGATAGKMGLPTIDAEFEDEYGEVIKYKKAASRDIDAILARYHDTVRGVKKLAKVARDTAESRGYIRTKYGRHLRFPRKYKSYKASGILIQATSADINKENWVLIDQALNGRGRMILNTHDSYSLSVPVEHLESVKSDVKRHVEREFLRIPLLLDYNGAGVNWWSALKNEGPDGANTNK